MTLLRELIDIPESVSDADFVVRASEAADLRNYVVTDQLRDSFVDALRTIGHAVTTGRSQAKFLHGSFGSGKSHFMAVLREVLQHNPDAREVRNLSAPIQEADAWLDGKRILTLTFHMLDARSVEEALLRGYLEQVTALHPDEPPPAVHRSDGLLDDAARLRERMGDEAFFKALNEGGGPAGGGGLASVLAARAGWTAETYAAAAQEPPGSEARDRLVSALTVVFYTGAVRSGEYLDMDSGLAVITRHAKSLGYDAMVLFLDELILWLSTKIADHTFVTTEGAKLNKLVESADAHRPLPVVSFVARQRNLEEFLGPQVGGDEKQALADVMRSVQGRLGNITLADTNLPEITEKRLLKPLTDAGKQTIDAAFAAVRNRREVWDILLQGAQYDDAGIGSDATAFRKLYPFSPALVATLVALSQALQRERTALKVMTELLSARRDTLRVNDLIGVATLFDPLVLRGELPDRPQLRQRFASARDTYLTKVRPHLLAMHKIGEAEAARNAEFARDDGLVKTLLLGALVPEVPALNNLTAGRLHALNFGSIASPIPGYENQMVLAQMRALAADIGVVRVGDGPDPVISLKLSDIDVDIAIGMVPDNEDTTGNRQRVIRDLVAEELGLTDVDNTFGDLPYQREWRGRRHLVNMRFGNVRDRDNLPDDAVLASGETWRVVVDYPFDTGAYNRNSDISRMETLRPNDSRTVLWLPYFLTNASLARVSQLVKIKYLLGDTGSGERINSLVPDWSVAHRQQARTELQQRHEQLKQALVAALRQAYGVTKAEQSDVEVDALGVVHTLAQGFRPGDPRGGTLKTAFHNLTGEMLEWSYPGRPFLPDDEKPPTRAELGKILSYARLAAADETRGVVVETADRRTVARLCGPLRLGALAEHRYVLNSNTFEWGSRLAQAAARRGHTDAYPVSLLLTLIDEPQPHGYDPDLKALIVALFALHDGLAWYRHDGKVEVRNLQDVRPDLVLRHPPMPSDEAWQEAVRKGKALFGKPLPEYRNPTLLGDLAGTMRDVAHDYQGYVTEVREALATRAGVLGLSEVGPGRLSTARRLASLLSRVSQERDDVVLVDLVAQADVGDIDFAAAGTAMKSAPQVSTALRNASWTLLEAGVSRAETDPRFDAVVEQLRGAARRDQHAADLAGALHEATEKITRLLTAEQPLPPTMPPVDKPPVVTPPVVPPVGTVPPVAPPTGDGSVVVRTTADLEAVLEKMRAEIMAGRAVTVQWERRQ